MKVAIVGSGRASKELHLPNFKANKECEIVALCDPAIDWTKKLAAEFGVPKVYPNLRECLQSEKIDAVSICSIPPNHLADVKTAFESGCHVLLEKPMALDIDEAKQMKAAGEKAGKVFTVVHNYKFTPGITQAISTIKSGEIGKVLRIQSNWQKSAENDRMAKTPDHWSLKLKGSRWAETLPHNVYILYNMVGPLKLRSASAKLVNPKHAWLRCDEVSVTLEHENGYADIELSGNNKAGNGNFVVTGTKGTLVSNYDTMHMEHMYVTPKMAIQCNAALAKSAVGKVAGKLGKGAAGGDHSGHRTVINGFVDEVLHGAKPLTPWDEAFHTMEIVDQIGEAIERQLKP